MRRGDCKGVSRWVVENASSFNDERRFYDLSTMKVEEKEMNSLCMGIALSSLESNASLIDAHRIKNSTHFQRAPRISLIMPLMRGSFPGPETEALARTPSTS